MKSTMFFLFLAVLSAAIVSCSDDKEAKKKGDADLAHTGERWTISSISNYTLSDVSTTGVISKTGSKTNAGSFYFVEAENKGSFEMDIEGYNKEDVFSYTEDPDGSINIVSVEQSVGATTNQNIIVISGERTSDTEIVIDAFTITKQSSVASIFSLVATTITLTKN